MSFSQKVKREIAAQEISGMCCITAACYGVACFSKSFDSKGMVLYTERAYIANWAKEMFEKAGVQGTVSSRGSKRSSYEFAVKDCFEVQKMLALFSHSGDETALHIRRENIECDRCFAAFAAAAFMSGGVVIDPEKGYLLEFISPRFSMMRDFEALLQEFGFVPGSTRRKGYNVLYFKASEQIEDLLTTMGASQSALEIMNLKVYKDFRNRANRITNCETANIDKIVAANHKVLLAIRKLDKAEVLKTLPEVLQQAAALRVQNPDRSLTELVEISQQPVSKSGLSHRYRKIIQMAEKLKESDS